MMKTGQGVSSRQDQAGEYVHVLVRAWLLDMSPKPPGFADEHVFFFLYFFLTMALMMTGGAGKVF